MKKGLPAFKAFVIFVILVVVVVTAAYVSIYFMGYRYSLNRSKMFFRCALLIVFAFESCLFSWRTLMYNRLGGDFSLARRSAIVILACISGSAIIESYYFLSSVNFFNVFGRLRMFEIIIFVVMMCVPVLPVIFNIVGSDTIDRLIIGSLIGYGLCGFLCVYMASNIILKVIPTANTLTLFGLVLRSCERFSPIYAFCILVFTVMLISGLLQRAQRKHYFAEMEQVGESFIQEL